MNKISNETEIFYHRGHGVNTHGDHRVELGRKNYQQKSRSVIRLPKSLDFKS